MKRQLIVLLPLFLAACAPALSSVTQAPEDIPDVSPPAEVLPSTGITLLDDPSQAPRITPNAGNNKRVDDPNEYNFRQLLAWDSIRPVYDPQFASVEDAPLQDSELVMGVAFNGEAKAYPVTVLRFREMVNDEIAGWPILVSW